MAGKDAPGRFAGMTDHELLFDVRMDQLVTITKLDNLEKNVNDKFSQLCKVDDELDQRVVAGDDKINTLDKRVVRTETMLYIAGVAIPLIAAFATWLADALLG